MRAPAQRLGNSAGCSGGSGSNLYTGSRHQERTDLRASAAVHLRSVSSGAGQARPGGQLVLLCHEVLEAAGTSGKAFGESVCQVEAQGCDRGLNVALRSEGERPGDGSSREGEVPGGSPSVDLRGEPGLAARPEIHTPRCTGRHDGGTRASPAPRSGPAPSPA